MLKYYNVIFLLLLFIIISPVNAVNTVCTPCPQQTPYIVYVTVTVPVPVPATPTPSPTQSRIDVTPTPPQSNIISQLMSNKEYIVYGFLFLLLIGGVIYMRMKQKKRKPPVIKPSQDISELYEETEAPEIKEEPKKPEKQKKQKKPKSLLDQDFEF